MKRHRRSCLTRSLALLVLTVLPIAASAQQMPLLQEPGVSPPFAGLPEPFQPPMPELGKKVAINMALREMLDMGLTARHISAALPALKELLAAEKALKTQAEQLLAAEMQALLKARPDDPMPEEVGEKMQKLMESHHTRQERIWAALGKTIGENRMNRLRGLIGQAGAPPVPQRPGAFPGRPFGGGGVEPGIQPPDEDDSSTLNAPLPPNVGRPPDHRRNDVQFVAQQPNPRPQRQRGSPSLPLPQPPFMPGGPMRPGWMHFGQPPLTLAELIDLLEQKLAAMRR